MRTTLSLHRETLRSLDAGRVSWAAGGLRFAQETSDSEETDCLGSEGCPPGSASCPEPRPVETASCPEA